MSTFILTISKINPPDESLLETVEKNHRTPQDEVVREYVDIKLDGGFVIAREDNLVAPAIAERPNIKKDAKTEEVIQKQFRFLREQAKYSKDTSLTKGEKPYENKPRINKGMDSRSNK